MKTCAHSHDWRNRRSAPGAKCSADYSGQRPGRRGEVMGCVYNRGSKGLPNYWIKWSDRGRNCFQRIGADKQLAKSTLAQIEGGLQKKKLSRKYAITTEVAPSVPTFDAAADAFIERRKAPDADGKPMRRAWKSDRARLDKYLRPHFGRKHLDELHEGDMRQLIDGLRKTLKPQSIRKCLAIVSRIYNEQPRALRLDKPVEWLDRGDRDSIRAAGART